MQVTIVEAIILLLLIIKEPLKRIQKLGRAVAAFFYARFDSVI